MEALDNTCTRLARELPTAEAVAGLDSIRAVREMFRAWGIDPARYRPNDYPMLLGNPFRLRDELGWTAEIPLEQTVDDLLEYWRARNP